MSQDFHSAAFYMAGRAVHAARTSQPLVALDVSDPNAVLSKAAREIASAVSLPNAVGAAAQRQGAARNPARDAATAPLRAPKNEPLWIEANRFVRSERQAIERLARALLSERKLSAEMAAWILNAKVAA